MKKKIIVIFTNSKEVNVPIVQKHLEELGEKYVIVDTEFLDKYQIDIKVSKKGKVEGSLKLEEEIDLKHIKSIWWRRPKDLYDVLDTDHQISRFVADEFMATLWSFATTFETYWMNPPLMARELLEHNKLHQIKIAQKVGLKVPETIITNNPKVLEEFVLSVGGKLAIKSVKSRLFTDKKNDTEGIYTQCVDLKTVIENSESIKLAPVMAQKYIPKKLELRITVVGKNIFCCSIDSQSSKRTMHDWRRYDLQNVEHSEFILPKEIQSKLLKLMNLWSLKYGAIDMILTPDGEYYFLEINPSGQYQWIEGMTGMPISETIAKTLANPTS